MSDAPSGFKTARVQLAKQSQDYEQSTHLRMGHRSRLKPVGAGFAENDLVRTWSFSADWLKRYPRVATLRTASTAGAETRRVFPHTQNVYHHAGGQDV